MVSILNNKQKTPVENKTLNPTYAGKDATFDFPIYLSLADKLGVLELVVWDKDMLSKEYLGEVALPLDDWFLERDGVTPRAYEWDSDSNKVHCALLCFSSLFVLLFPNAPMMSELSRVCHGWIIARHALAIPLPFFAPLPSVATPLLHGCAPCLLCCTTLARGIRSDQVALSG